MYGPVGRATAMAAVRQSAEDNGQISHIKSPFGTPPGTPCDCSIQHFSQLYLEDQNARQPRLLPPSAGLQVCIRRLLEARPETTKEAHAILARPWPRIDPATSTLAYDYYLEATEPEEVPGSTVAITVAPIG
jgi:hypothetical protein